MMDFKINFKLEFKIRKILFYDEISKFTILNVKVIKHNYKDHLNSLVTIKGNFQSLYEGDSYECMVKIIDDKKYGYCIIPVDIPILKLPQNEEALIKFIQKRVKGLGLKKATNIVKLYGLETLQKIKEDYTCLLKVDGIIEKKALAIAATLNDESFEELATFMQAMEIETKISVQIYDYFKEDSVSRIKNNPYCICNETGLSFKYADKIASILNYPNNNPERLKSLICEYLFQRTKQNGDLCTIKDTLLLELSNFSNRFNTFKNTVFSKNELESALDDLIFYGHIKYEFDNNNICYIYRTSCFYTENTIVDNFKKILSPIAPFCLKEQIDEFLSSFESNTMKLANKQKEAVYIALLNRVSVLTGGPGTGKTATTNVIVKCIKHIKPNALIKLLAPTGKASNRMSELTNMKATTIHRMLGLNPSSFSKTKVELIADYVIIDESSMIDAFIFDKLLESIGDETRILFVGDINQLPSVGPGLILRDIIDSNVVPVVQLTEIFRQAKLSRITMNAHKIIAGLKTTDIDGVDIKKDINSDFAFWKTDSVEKVRENILKSIERTLELGYNLNDICVLSPMKMGHIGTIELNRIIQKIYNPPSEKPEYEVDSALTFRIGDKVIQVENNPDLNVFNGEIGVITNIYDEINEGIKIVVDFSTKDNDIIYNEKNLRELELAYAMTIHKSQGSEFPIIIIPVHESQQKMLNRNLLYTGITRAKKKVILIGQEDIFNYGISKTDAFKRISRLKSKLALILKSA